MSKRIGKVQTECVAMKLPCEIFEEYHGEEPSPFKESAEQQYPIVPQ